MTLLTESLRGHDRFVGDGFVQGTETLTFNNAPLLAIWTQPLGARRRTALVVCPSLFEVTTLQHVEMALMRAAAAAGFPCIYVQPPGVGDSVGSLTGESFAEWVDVAAAGFDFLRSRHPSVDRVCFGGPRLGAAVALVAAARDQSRVGAFLWDPALDPIAYWNDVRRLDRVTAVGKRLPNWEDADAQLERQGWASVLGRRIARPFRDGLQRSADAIQAAAGASGPTFVAASSDNARDAAIREFDASRPIETFSAGLPHLRLGLAPPMRHFIEPTLQWLQRTLG